MKKKDSTIFVAGHRGLVGSALVRCLELKGYHQIITATHAELNLENQAELAPFFHKNTPDFIFLAAAYVGGIHANNTYPADFIYRNLMIQNNVINAAYEIGIQRLVFLGSSCIYPKECEQPIKEEFLLTGLLEPTNESYAIAKIAGIKLCEAYNRQYGTEYLSVMPTNLYGPGDNFDLNTSHVLPALIRKAHEAKVNGESEMGVWGSGTPRREFLYVDDMADACVFMMEQNITSGLYNIGTGQDIEIKALAELVAAEVGFTGRLTFDNSKPDGTLRKQLDVSKIKALGWQASTSLRDGIRRSYEWYQRQI